MHGATSAAPYVMDALQAGGTYARGFGRGFWQEAGRAPQEFFGSIGSDGRISRTISVGHRAGVEALGVPGSLLRNSQGRWLPRRYSVYFGVRDGKRVYVGVTKDLRRRQAEHGERFVVDEVHSRLTKRQARAIEQALIEGNPQFENIINSIAPRHTWYNDAVGWAARWLEAQGLS